MNIKRMTFNLILMMIATFIMILINLPIFFTCLIIYSIGNIEGYLEAKLNWFE
jgi:hypothetical protein